ncbi:FUSC family protein [Luteimonas aquatica]|uniref:FUSC family protein n=1 Tax=Luteimonas aquatica TaxID=450364 RepID=UPI001F5900DC|nr:FUSC family protein [Luteimonas aquatica]
MLRSLIVFQPREVPARVALRNTVTVVAPLAVGIAIDQVPAGLAMTVGALNTMFTDLPGPYRLRMQRMLLAAASAGLAALIGILVGPCTPLFVATVAVFGAVGGLLVALGPVAARVGLTNTIVMMITAEMQVAPGHAPGVAALILAGGLLQTLMAVAAWPLQRYRPERFALATVLEQLADTARIRPDPSQPPPVSQAATDALQLLHGQHRSRGIAVQSFRIVAELCERVRIDLLSLGELHGRIREPAVLAAIDAVLNSAERVLQRLAVAMREAEPPLRAESEAAGFAALVEALAQARQGLTDAQQPSALRERRLSRIALARAQSLAGQLRALVRNSDWASSRGEIRAELAEARLPAALRPGNPLQTLRANLKLSSIALRHALRSAVCVSIAAACERMLQIPHGVWIPMTAAIVLKPDFGGTMQFGVLRVVGTLIGLLIGTAVAHLAMDGVAMRLALMALLCFVFRLLVQVNYAVGVAMLTAMLVLLLSFEGIAPGEAVEMRILGTVLGSALALAAYALWPTWEGRRTTNALATLVEAYRTHIAAVLGRDAATGNFTALYETRSAARAARTNALASVERLRAEPKRGAARARLAWTESFLANAHRLIRATLSLEALLRDETGLPQLPELGAFAEQADQALARIAAALREERPPQVPSLRPAERRLSEALAALPDAGAAGIALADACDRIVDAVDTLAHLLQRDAAAATAAAPMTTAQNQRG